MRRPRFLALAAALALAACAGRPDYFLTPPPAQVDGGRAPAGAVAVADMSLPAYAETVEIAVLTGTGAVQLSKEALWADTPRRRQLMGIHAVHGRASWDRKDVAYLPEHAEMVKAKKF